MKSILLASASAIVFAGAAAAEVSWSGSAKGTYNLPIGETSGNVTTEVKLNAAATVAGDWTLSAGLNSKNGTWSKGAVSLTDGTSTLTFGSALGDGAYDALRTSLTTTSTTTTLDDVDFIGSTVLGGATVTLTHASPVDGDNWELGVSMSAAGFDIDAAMGLTGDNANDFAVKAASTMGDLSLGVNFLSEGGTSEYDVSVGYTMGAATVSVATDNIMGAAGDYDVKLSYAMGDATISAAINEDQDWNAGVKWASGGMSASVAYYADADTPANDHVRASVGYTMDALSIAASTRTSDNRVSLSGNYDLGNGMKVFAGTRTKSAAENYVGVEAALGDATLTLSYSDTGAGKASDTAYEKEFAAGTTLGVSFKF